MTGEAKGLAITKREAAMTAASVTLSPSLPVILREHFGFAQCKLRDRRISLRVNSAKGLADSSPLAQNGTPLCHPEPKAKGLNEGRFFGRFAPSE